MSVLAVLLKSRWRGLCNLRRVARRQSFFKLGFIALFAVALLMALWGMFYGGFAFLDRMGGSGRIIIPRLFALFFMGMGLMLAVSGAVSAYATVYRSDETPWLLLHPVPTRDLMAFKFFESTLFASWAFFFIIIPFIGAYAWHERLPVYFSIWVLLFAVPFSVWFAGMGFLLACLAVRWLPKAKWPYGIAAVLLAGWLSIWWIRTGEFASPAENATLMLTQLAPGMRLASYPLLPSWWTAEGLVALSQGEWVRGGLFWLTLLSNALVMVLVVEEIGTRIFRPSWERLTGGGRAARRARLLPLVERVLGWLPPDMRAIILKDLRTFLRDPQQWLQALVFLGLLALYFLNLRKFRYHMMPEQWRNLVAFLNVFSASAVLCSLGARFVYPQMSLEGQAFWLYGLAPTTMVRILWAKFLGAAFSMTTAALVLMTLSVRMLQLDALFGLAALVVGVSVALVVAGLSTGLGAVFLDLRQRNPAAVVSSFGGTLNLTLSLMFLLAVTFPMAILVQMRRLRAISGETLNSVLAWSLLGLAVLVVICVAGALWWGARTLRQREY